MADTEDCPTCKHARLKGWFGLARGTHCRGCHRSWTSQTQAHCTVCHQQFVTNGTADVHWVRGTHALPGEVCDKAGVARLVRDAEQVWHYRAPETPLSHWKRADP